MIISDSHKFIFIHIPKSGGTSVKHVLRELPSFTNRAEEPLNNFFGDLPLRIKKIGKAHLKGSHIMQGLGEEVFSKYFKFSFVRNPWERMVSQYNYTMANGPCRQSVRKDLLKQIGIDKSASFNKYINHVFKAEVHAMWDEQYKFLYINEKCAVDYIGKFENFQEDFDIICDKIGISKQELPHKNKTKHNHYTEYYNDETRQIVAEKFAKDIEYFNYNFGD